MKIFVFGSNLAGRHGAGAARTAFQEHGAIYGQGSGPMGRSYAIPTKDREMLPLPLEEVAYWVSLFVEHAKLHPELQFYVTRVGCGLAGYKDHQIAPLFRGSPKNCELPEAWQPFL